ncbi:competence/damage-inducible protein A [Enterococcus songbeiensis]|uniref:competence/damage-inducible protein A n=1 Tax=Enterococcus songbeiensis TaxID=2559927 RepID=UPI0010F83310|nr:competence/damage-inducible protein A [Enterococcus songbeiensis]
MKAEIIAVGTEILLGQVVNTNATFLSEELADLGIEVYYHSVVGDNRQRLEALLKMADQRSDLVILCGGLGPTDDDLTKVVVAEHVGQKLVRNEAGYQQLVAFFQKLDREMTANNLRQILVFEEGQVFPNDTGLALGIFYEGTTDYLLLPGPPSELQPMFLRYVKPMFQTYHQQDQQLYSRVLRFYGIGESNLVTTLADLIETQTNPTIAPYAKTNEVTLRLTAKASEEAVAALQLDQVEKKIMDRVGDYFYGYGEENSLAAVVVALLKAQNRSITAAESLTAGLFQATLGNIAGVSSVFPGGFVTYSATTKQEFLGISPELIEQFGTVSQECAEQMAQKARQKANTDYALAFTGVAGPEELEGQPAGTVWLALATPQGISSRKYRFTRDRSHIRHSAVMAGLDLLRRELLKEK